MFKLLALAGKPAGSITDDELAHVAGVIGGGDSPVFADFLRLIRSAEPSTPVTELLRSPTAIKMLESIIKRQQDQNNEEADEVFCRCPSCGFGFITTLK